MAQSYHPDPPPQQIVARCNPLKNKALRFPVKIMQKKLATRGGFCIFHVSADALPTQPTKTMTTNIITARAKAFSNEGIRKYKFQIDGKTVRVWDSVAGYFTTCHSLSKSAIIRIRRLAA